MTLILKQLSPSNRPHPSTHRLSSFDLLGLLAEDELLLAREDLVDALPVEHRDLGVELLDLRDEFLGSCNSQSLVGGQPSERTI